MKKVMKDAPRQARRQRALDRFSIDPKRKTDEEYMARKHEELASLQRVLPLQN